MPLADILKETTADAHRRAEAGALQRQLVQGRLDERRLAAYLAQLRAVHAEIERRFDDLEEVARAIGWSDEMRHSRRLDRDLAALGVSAEHTARRPATDRVLEAIEGALAREPVALVGFLYVLEGSMNGNRFIVRALRATPAAERCPFAYFDPYGADQPARWTAFRAGLDAVDLDDSGRAAIQGAALRMFEAINEIAGEVMEAAPPEVHVNGHRPEIAAVVTPPHVR